MDVDDDDGEDFLDDLSTRFVVAEEVACGSFHVFSYVTTLYQ